MIWNPLFLKKKLLKVKNSKKIARIISDLFVPPVFTLVSFIILGFKYESDFFYKSVVIGSGAILGFILPILFFLYLRKKGKVINNDATIKEERNFPYFVGVLFCLTGFTVLYLLGSNEFAVSLWMVYAVNTLLLIAVNKFWKISAHAIGASTFLGLMAFLYGSAGFYFLPLILLIGAARLVLKVHTSLQVIAGTFFGFLLTYYQLYLLTGLLR